LYYEEVPTLWTSESTLSKPSGIRRVIVLLVIQGLLASGNEGIEIIYWKV